MARTDWIEVREQGRAGARVFAEPALMDHAFTRKSIQRVESVVGTLDRGQPPVIVPLRERGAARRSFEVRLVRPLRPVRALR